MQVAHMTSATRSFCSYMRSWCSETTSENSNFKCCSPKNSQEDAVLQRTHQIYHVFCCEERWEDFNNSMHWVHLHKHVSKGTIWGCSMHKEHTPVFCRWPYPCQRGCCHILEIITTYNCPNAKPSSIKRSTTKNGTSKLIEKRIFQKTRGTYL